MTTSLRLPTGGSLATALLLVAVLSAAAITGLALGVGFYIAAAPIVLLLPVALLLTRPDISLIAVAGLTLFVAGLLKFFFGIGQFQWLISGFGTMLLAIALAKMFFKREVSSVPTSGVSLLLALWWIVLVFSSLANFVPILDWFVGIRIYLPFFGVFAYIAYCRPSERLLKGLLVFLLVVASIQWIFCIYQKFMVVPARIAAGYPGSPWDSVVGTFGGEKFGGGESGSLGVFLAISITLVAALHKSRMLGGTISTLIAILVFGAVGLAESKVVVVLVPLGVLIVYSDYVIKHPVKFLFGGMIMGLLVIALLAGYHYMYWQSDSRLGLWDAVVQRLGYSFDPNFRVTSANLGRVGSLVFWWDKHSILDNPLGFFLGHGLASAVGISSAIGMGTAVKAYGYLLDTTGATKLLWETGMFGLLLFLAVFVAGFERARKLSNSSSVPGWHRAAMSGVQAAMVLMPMSVFYEVTVVSSPPMQFVAMLLLGYVVYWWRETSGGRQ